MNRGECVGLHLNGHRTLRRPSLAANARSRRGEPLAGGQGPAITTMQCSIDLKDLHKANGTCALLFCPLIQ